MHKQTAKPENVLHYSLGWIAFYILRVSFLLWIILAPIVVLSKLVCDLQNPSETAQVYTPEPPMIDFESESEGNQDEDSSW